MSHILIGIPISTPILRHLFLCLPAPLKVCNLPYINYLPLLMTLLLLPPPYLISPSHIQHFILSQYLTLLNTILSPPQILLLFLSFILDSFFPCFIFSYINSIKCMVPTSLAEFFAYIFFQYFACLALFYSFYYNFLYL